MATATARPQNKTVHDTKYDKYELWFSAKCEIENMKNNTEKKIKEKKGNLNTNQKVTLGLPINLFCPVHETCVRKELWREACRLITAHFQKPIPVKQKRDKDSEKLSFRVCCVVVAICQSLREQQN